MTNKTFLTLHGAIYTSFALALFFVPSFLWPMYGVEINDQYAYFLSQHTSIFLGSVAAISLFMRNIEAGVAMTQLLKALLFGNLLGVVITTYAGLTGIFVGFGWSDPAFFTLLSVINAMQLRKTFND
ncbi:hypothetical protein [Vibrio taketomensis]|uniref:hypothetical protein n=1 Tax=Vibrio taketomensis TaxID=2572923 RepID=UPI001389B292|nr:hypothetical protein [Vibrio taketomensis]